MSKDRYVITGKKTLKNRDGSTRDILITKPADRPPCKGCGKEPSRNGSRFGENCKNAYEAQKLTDRRLASKITQQTTKP